MVAYEPLSHPTCIAALRTVVERQLEHDLDDYRVSDQPIPVPARRKSLLAVLRSLVIRRSARQQPHPARHATA